MIKAKCTWKVQGDRPVSDAIVYFEDNENIDLEDAISAENCVQLEAPVDDDVTGNYIVPACQVFLFCGETHQMSSVSILSEARVIEVYGYHGEYLSTLKNELMEEVDGMSVFRGDLNLTRPLKECCLKFIPLKSKDSMWLYGIKVVVQEKPRPDTLQLFPTSMPLKDVEERLEASGAQLSEKAESLKRMMELFQGTTGMLSAAAMSPVFAGFSSLSRGAPQQVPDGMAQFYNLFQNAGLKSQMHPTPAKQAPKPPLAAESAREAVLPTPSGTGAVETGQDGLLAGILKLLENHTAKQQPQYEPLPQAVAKAKVSGSESASLDKEFILELLEKSGVLNKETATVLLAEIIQKTGATVQLNQPHGDAEKNSTNAPAEDVTAGQPNNAAEKKILETTSRATGTDNKPSKETGSQTDQPEPVPTANQEPQLVPAPLTMEALQMQREETRDVVGALFQGLQDQLLNLVDRRFEELKVEMVEKLDGKIQEMEERINARFDAIIDALQGQEDEEEIFEQPEEGSV
ncbi:uncharacterized protein LOC119431877 isoform X1 [Dermacentor silvarum]|uniref:uncharacterized protein LOC119431877 isoform X1 n=2 Tax=Dermacentor silvarum TaxID=543639 RepID=UPI00189AD9F9|nr:uncharacterized protein LOC119431877 isoform X1 [Dermacentor silvarum]